MRCAANNGRSLGNDGARSFHVSRFDCVANGGEEGLVVSRPSLRPKDDVLELRSIRHLFIWLVRLSRLKHGSTYAAA